ncbi:MAG: calcium-binding protein, partial [Pseudomonadota bacterium]
GMAGDDEIAGHKGDDGLSGGDGFDVIRGGRGSGTLYGAAADDLITGYIGADTILGGVGDDTIRGGFGADDLHGGEGTDTASYRFSAMGVAVSLAEGVGAGGQAEGDVLTEFENLVGSASDDILVGDEGDNALTGLAGDDVLRGRRGDDALEGGMGDDFMVGGLGADTFVFSDADFGRDVVADWTDGEDALDFSALGLDFADFTISQAGADAVLTLASDPDASLTLLATNSGVIDQFDFI